MACFAPLLCWKRINDKLQMYGWMKVGFSELPFSGLPKLFNLLAFPFSLQDM
jgi:hypothetical protein